MTKKQNHHTFPSTCFSVFQEGSNKSTHFLSSFSIFSLKLFKRKHKHTDITLSLVRSLFLSVSLSLSLLLPRDTDTDRRTENFRGTHPMLLVPVPEPATFIRTSWFAPNVTTFSQLLNLKPLRSAPLLPRLLLRSPSSSGTRFFLVLLLENLHTNRNRRSPTDRGNSSRSESLGLTGDRLGWKKSTESSS